MFGIIKVLLKAGLGIFGIFIALGRTIISNIFIFGIICITILGLGYVFNYFISSPVALIRPNNKPDFDIQATNGGQITPRSLKNRYYILYFTSPQCDKCKEQVPALTKLKEDYNAHIYAVFADEENSVIKDLYRYKRIINTAMLDDKHSLHRQFFAFILPHLSVVNPKGEIVLDITGAINERDLNRIIKVLQSEENKDKAAENAQQE